MSTDLNATLAANRIVVAAFSSPWCAPCRALEAALAPAVDDRPGVVALHIDIAAEPAIAQTYRVQATPTLIGFVDGEPVAQAVGYAGPHGLRKFLDGLIEQR